jgi:hypothetical protein
MMHGGEKSDPAHSKTLHSSDEADEQSRATGGGPGGAKGGDQEERGPAKHAPGAGPRSVSQALDRWRMHQPIPERGRWLRRVVAGLFAYHAVPTNSAALGACHHCVTDQWRRSPRRRSQKNGLTWERMTKLANDWPPKPRILHPWPNNRFAGDGLRSRTEGRRATAVGVAVHTLNRMLDLGRPNYVHIA